MQKKRILNIQPVATTETGVIAREVEVRGEKHLLLDFYDNGFWWLRYAFTEKDYGRYLVEEERWSVQDSWYLYIEDRGCLREVVRNNQKAIDKKTINTMKRWSKAGSIEDAIYELERRIDQIKAGKKADAEAELREQMFATMPDMDNRFFIHIDIRNKASNLIYYKRHGKKSEFKCAQCGMEWMDNKYIPVKGMGCRCRYCEEYGILEWRDRCKKSTIWDFYTVFQATTDHKLVARCFWSRTERTPYRKMEKELIEIYRCFIGMGKVKNYYSFFQGNGDRRWSTGRGNFVNEIKDSESFNDLMEVLKETELKYMPERLFYVTNCDRDKGNVGSQLNTVKAYARCPHLEMLFKMGMKPLCRDIIWRKGGSSLINKKGRNIEEILKIRKADLPYILENGGEMLHKLQVCQYLKEAGLKNTPEMRGILVKMTSSYGYGFESDLERLKEITQYTTIIKAYNYLVKQADGSSISYIKGEYIDYLKERAGEGYDMTNTVYLFPKDLHGTYSRLLEEKKQRRNAERDKKLREEFKKIEERYSGLSKKYGYQDEMFILRPARNVMEIINEGRTLHHCVGSEHQDYMKNHNDGKSFILFLRKASEPDTPYATIEIKDSMICQWYQANDRKPDKDIIQPWLDKYVAQLNKKSLKAAV